MDKLRECPFCNCADVVFKDKKSTGYWNRIAIKCNGCNMQTKDFAASDRSLDYTFQLAANAWNRREGETK